MKKNETNENREKKRSWKDSTPYERKARFMVLICWLAYATVYIGKKNFNQCLPLMIDDGVCTETMGGTIGACFLACYAAGQFINGWIGEKLHPKHMICGGVFLAGLFNVLMGISSSSLLMAVLWGACGLACSMTWAPIIRAVSTWTTKPIAVNAAASLAISIPVGTIAGNLVCSVAFKVSGWRAAFIACGSILVVGSLIYYLMFSRLKDHMVTPEKTETAESDVPVEALKPSGSKWAAILCVGMLFTAFAIFFNGMLKDGLDQWIPTLLGGKFISNPAVVPVITSILPIFNIFGVYVCKFFFVRCRMSELGASALMFAFSTVAMGLVALMLVFSFTGVWAAVIVTLLLAFSSASMLGANSMILNYLPLHYAKIGRASALTGMLNCFSYAAASGSAVLTGAVLENGGSDWLPPILLFLGAALLGCVVCVIGRSPLNRKLKELDEME